jgi:hypothetical protein
LFIFTLIKIKMKIGVIGSRSFKDYLLLEETMNKLSSRLTISLIVSGGAKGADTLAGYWAVNNGVPVEEYKAEWDKYGKKAGYLRNQKMLDEGKPDLVVAFPGGPGTAMMVKIARKAGVPVHEVPQQI